MITARKALARDAGGRSGCSEPVEVVIVVRVASAFYGPTTETRLCRRCSAEMSDAIIEARHIPAPRLPAKGAGR